MNNLRNVTLKIIFSLWFVFAFLYYEILFKCLGNIDFGNLIMFLLYPIALGFLAYAVITVLPKSDRIRLIFAELILTISSIYFIAEYFVGSAFQTFMTSSAILSNAANVTGDFGNEVLTTIRSGWYIILIFLLPSILTFFWRKKILFHFETIDFSEKYIQLFSVFSVFLLIFANCYGSMVPSFSSEYSFDSSMRKNGVFSTFFGEISASRSDDVLMLAEEFFVETIEEIPVETEIVYEENVLDIDFKALAQTASSEATVSLDKYLASQSGSLQNEYTGLFEGKNLILITAEAFSNFAVDETLTPTLYRMMHNGFYFSDYYQPVWGGSTSTGEYSVLSGLVPTSGVQSMVETADNNLYLTIGNQLSLLGYRTAAYHNNSYTYYSRDLTHTNFGYSTYTGIGNGMEKGVEDCWPESDLEMIDFTLPQYIDHQPFHVYYMSVSGHCTYNTDGNAMVKKNWEAVKDLPYSDSVKGYYAAQLEFEYAMASLIEQLETAGILDDTVICISSDHYPYGLEEGQTWGNSQNYLPELYGVKEEELDMFVRDQNALIIWSGCLENDLKDYATEIRTPAYSLDILPTLSNLFGVEYDSRMLVGRDVFSDQAALVLWPDYSWRTEKGTYEAGSETFIPAENTEVSEEYIQQIKTIVANKITLSKTTLEQDYWNHVFGK